MVWNVNVGKTNDNSINGLTFQTQNMKMQNVGKCIHRKFARYFS